MPIKTSIITASCAAAVLMLGGCQAHDEIPAAVIFHEVSAALDLPQTGQTSGAVWVDLDDDGRRDLLLGRHHRVPEAYRHLDDLRFAPMPDWGQAMDAFDHHATLADDIDQDGHLDFYFVVGAHRGEGVGRNTLYLGGQDHTTNTAEPWGIADPFGRGRGVVLLDPDRDELPDLFVLNFRTAPRAYTIAPPDPVMDSLEKLLGIPAADDRSVASGTDRKSAEFIHRLLPLDLEADGQVDFLALGGALPLSSSAPRPGSPLSTSRPFLLMPTYRRPMTRSGATSTATTGPTCTWSTAPTTVPATSTSRAAIACCAGTGNGSSTSRLRPSRSRDAALTPSPPTSTTAERWTSPCSRRTGRPGPRICRYS